MKSIESVRQAMRAWRQEHRRGPLPVAIRRAVIQIAEEIGEKETTRATGVKPPTIERWRAKYGSAASHRRASPSAFVELRPELARPANKSGLRLELTAPGGYWIRVDGARDIAELATIIRAAVRDGYEA